MSSCMLHRYRRLNLIHTGNSTVIKLIGTNFESNNFAAKLYLNIYSNFSLKSKGTACCTI